MFGAGIPIKWYVTYDFKDITYYLTSSDGTAHQLVWSQQRNKALRFDSSADAEKVMALIMSHRKNKKLPLKIK